MKLILLLLLVSCISQEIIDENEALKVENLKLRKETELHKNLAQLATNKTGELTVEVEKLKKQMPKCVTSVVVRTGDCDEYGYCDAWIKTGDFESLMYHPYIDMAVQRCKGEVNWRKIETNIEEEQ